MKPCHHQKLHPLWHPILIISSPSSSFTQVPSLKYSPASPRSLSQCHHHFLYVFELPPILSFFWIWPRSHSSSYNSLKTLLSPWRPFCLPLPGKAPQIYIYIYTCAWEDQYYWRIWHKWVYRRDANFMFANLVCILNTAQPFYHALLEAPATFTNFISSLGFQSLYCQDMKRMMTSILQGEWLFPSSLSLQHFIQMVNIIASRI